MAISGRSISEGVPLRGLAEAQAEAAEGRRLPPVERWNPPHCGTLPIEISADGRWHYLGSEIARPALVRLFSTILRREPDGSYVLVTPAEKITITVADAPFLAVQMEVMSPGPAQVISFLTNVGDRVTLDAAHPLRVAVAPATGEPRPYVRVRGGLEARLARPVFYELVELALEAEGQLVVHSAGARFVLGAI